MLSAKGKDADESKSVPNSCGRKKFGRHFSKHASCEREYDICGRKLPSKCFSGHIRNPITASVGANGRKCPSGTSCHTPHPNRKRCRYHSRQLSVPHSNQVGKWK